MDTAYLAETPDSSGLVRPPLREALHTLPFGEMGWSNFERLVARLAEQGADDVEHVAIYGAPGHAQRGIDVKVRLGGGRRALAQCRRRERVTAGQIAGAVDDFLAGEWANAIQFVYATAASASSPRVQDAIDAQTDRLEAEGVAFEVWDEQALSRKLKNHPELVVEFFGEAWVEAFCPQHAPALSLRSLTRDVTAGMARDRSRRTIVLAADAGIGVQRATAELAEHATEELALVEGLLAMQHPPAAAAAAAELIDAPPASVESASWRLWVLLAQMAARGGRWAGASKAWERASEKHDDDPRALVEAAIAADVAGDQQRETRLRARARELAPEDLKLRLDEIDGIQDPGTRLEQLAELHPTSNDEAGLVACHIGLAHLQRDEIAAAERQAAAARDLAPHLLQIDSLELNIAVHRGRVDLLAERSIDEEAMARAEERALGLRARLHEQRRWHEAARVLMLAVDAATVRVEPDRAAELLDAATPEELAAGDGALALAAAALRGRHWAHALRLAGDIAGDEAKRIAATARLAMGLDADGRSRQLLERFAREDGPESTDAAMALLLDAGLRRGPWSEAAAARLITTKRVEVLSMRAMHLAATGHYSTAVDSLKPHRNIPWAKRALFVMAHDEGAPEKPALAEEVLATNPDRALRLLCARALMHAERLDRAEAEARTVAEDRSASPATRADAYCTLTDVLGRADRWDDAHTELNAWQNIRPGDARLGAWRARVGNRRIQIARWTSDQAAASRRTRERS